MNFVLLIRAKCGQMAGWQGGNFADINYGWSLVPQEQLFHKTAVQHRRRDVVQHCTEDGGCVNTDGNIAFSLVMGTSNADLMNQYQMTDIRV